MKIIKILSASLILTILFFACKEEYLDPISQVDPGPDETAPNVVIEFPQEGTKIKVLEEVTSVEIQFEVTDDIEVGNIELFMDGNSIATFSEFKDYRRVVDSYVYDQLTDGSHTLRITASDLEGKTTTEEVTFEKEPAYVPKYAGEVLYMPFDGDVVDLVSITRPTVIGDPGYSDDAILGRSYQGAEGAYLTFPAAELTGDELSAAFWMKVNPSPDRAGILVIGPPDEGNPDAANNRTSGFRFFRENAGGEQRFKLNVGTNGSDSWFDGQDAADVDPSAGAWVHFAFTISQSRAAVYINGQVVREGEFGGVGWDNCEVLSIMSGEPNFIGWNHRSDQSLMDELRMFNRELSQEEIAQIIMDDSGGTGYVPKYEAETLYLPFDGSFSDRITGMELTQVGSPGFAGEGKVGSDAYQGAPESYLTLPTADYVGDEFSAVFWMKINAEPDRAGILVAGPPDAGNPDAQNNRTAGFRFFRENAGGNQRFKLNVGSGEADSWFDGGEAADVDPTTGEWVHFAFTISQSMAAVYINGEVVREGDFAGVDWTGCDVFSIMSGAPRFTGWNHFSDQSAMDELRFFSKALTIEEIQTIMQDEM